MNHRKRAKIRRRRGRGRGTIHWHNRTAQISHWNVRINNPNYWHVVSDFVYNKIVLRDVERLWLQENAPSAVITYEKVHNCEMMPLFRSGEWNGKAFFVSFAEKSGEAMAFRLAWWNTRA